MALGRKTGGRQKGSVNKVSRVREQARLLAHKGQTPLEYMLTVMHNAEAEPTRRDDMAKAAAPYLHARRAPEDKEGNAVPTVGLIKPDWSSLK
jgi:hypothetical protein